MVIARRLGNGSGSKEKEGNNKDREGNYDRGE